MISDLALVTRFHDQFPPSLVFILAPSLMNGVHWQAQKCLKMGC